MTAHAILWGVFNIIFGWFLEAVVTSSRYLSVNFLYDLDFRHYNLLDIYYIIYLCIHCSKKNENSDSTIII